MPSTFFGLTIASSGLNAAHVAINTTGHNISNIETKGYSRQQAIQQADDALRAYSSYGMMGSGVVVTDIQQIRDSYYDKKYWSNQCKLGEASSKFYYMDQIQDQFYNELEDVGFTPYYGNFANALDELSHNPADGPTRNAAINAGQTFMEYFNNISTNLRTYQDEANLQIRTTVNRINTLSQNIASLNLQIATLEMNGGMANDLRDERNNSVDELSQLVGITLDETVSPTGSSVYNIKIGNQELVSGTSYHTIELTTRDKKKFDTDVEDLYELSWDNGLSFDVEDPSLSGALRGYIDIRDGSNLVKPNYPETAEGRVYKGIPYYEKQLNEFVKAYTEEFNKLQMKGVKGTAEGLDGTSTADIPFFTIKDMTTDEIKQAIVDANNADANNTAITKDDVTSDQIIEYISQNITAGNACVNPDIIANNDLMATATQVVDGVDGNDVILAMNDLRNQKIFKGRIAEDAVKSLVAVSSVNASAAKSAQTNFNNNSKSIINQRLMISGVDKEEEGVDLVKFQRAYDLASKVINVMNQLYDKLINETGV